MLNKHARYSVAEARLLHCVAPFKFIQAFTDAARRHEGRRTLPRLVGRCPVGFYDPTQGVHPGIPPRRAIRVVGQPAYRGGPGIDPGQDDGQASVGSEPGILSADTAESVRIDRCQGKLWERRLQARRFADEDCAVTATATAAPSACTGLEGGCSVHGRAKRRDLRPDTGRDQCRTRQDCQGQRTPVPLHRKLAHVAGVGRMEGIIDGK